MSELNIIRYKLNKSKYLSSSLIHKISPLKAYKLSHTKRANEIIASIPKGLSNKEKAYHVYLELGKRVSEDPKFVFGDVNNSRQMADTYEEDLTEDGYGICKSIAETYHSILRDKRVGVKSVLIKSSINKQYPHIDCLLLLNEKEYLTNLIGDLSRIKTGKRTRRFGYRLEKTEEDPDFISDPIEKKYAIERNIYATRMHRLFPNLSYFGKAEMEDLDLKVGYSYEVINPDGDGFGVYTNDVFDHVYQAVGYGTDDTEYDFDKKDVTKKDEKLKIKIDTILDVANSFIHKNGNINYLENIRFLERVFKRMLPGEDLSRIVPYVVASKRDVRRITSVIKIKNDPEDRESASFYYVREPDEEVYTYYSKEGLKDYFASHEDLEVIGIMDRKRRNLSSEDIVRES